VPRAVFTQEDLSLENSGSLAKREIFSNRHICGRFIHNSQQDMGEIQASTKSLKLNASIDSIKSMKSRRDS
jgi:hypothetical protein